MAHCEFKTVVLLRKKGNTGFGLGYGKGISPVQKKSFLLFIQNKVNQVISFININFNS